MFVSVRNLDINQGELTTIQLGSDSLGILKTESVSQKLLPFIGYLSQFTINNVQVLDILQKTKPYFYVQNTARFGHYVLNLDSESLVFTKPDSMFVVKQPIWSKGKIKLIIEMEFKPAYLTQGLIYFVDLSPKTETNKGKNNLAVTNFIAVELWQQSLKVSFDFTSQVIVEPRKESNDQLMTNQKFISMPATYQWNILQLEVLEHDQKNQSYLIVRMNGEPRSIFAEMSPWLFATESSELEKVHAIGGVPYWLPKSRNEKMFSSPSGFVGCIRSIHINGQLVDRNSIESQIGEIGTECQATINSGSIGYPGSCFNFSLTKFFALLN